MQCNVIALTVFCLVSVLLCEAKNIDINRVLEFPKIQDDPPWIWGYAEDIKHRVDSPNLISTTASTIASTTLRSTARTTPSTTPSTTSTTPSTTSTTPSTTSTTPSTTSTTPSTTSTTPSTTSTTPSTTSTTPSTTSTTPNNTPSTKASTTPNNTPSTKASTTPSTTFSTTPSTQSGSVGTTENPCEYRWLEKPDFRAPGRRISRIKCYEYIWLIQFRIDFLKKEEECIEYNKRRGYYPSIGGRDALPGEFPHMAAIGWKAVAGTWIFKCGGSLISSKFVLTAAHCCEASPRDTSVVDVIPKIVRMGDKNILDDWSYGYFPKQAEILKIIIHPDYVAPKKYFDIALLEIEQIEKFTSNLHPGCLWTDFDTSSLGNNATLTGWGVVDVVKRTKSPVLQAAVVDILDTKMCDRLLRPTCNRNWCGVQEHQICAGKLAGGVDACQGDSGGPLQVKIPLPPSNEAKMHYIIGVTSSGSKRCAVADIPGLYTRVSSFIDWIEDIVWPQKKNSTIT